MKTLLTAVALSFALAGAPALAKPPTDQRSKEIGQALEHFHKDQHGFMNQHVKKLRANPHPKFREHQKGNTQHLKHAHRVKHHRAHPAGKEGPAYNDQAVNLVDKLVVTKLEDMEAKKLMSAQLAETPWSDDYWAIYLGGIAKRYADPTLGYGENWKKNTDLVKAAWKRPQTPAEIDKLSPAEKYDLLVGDKNRGLTNHQMSEGAEYAKPDGSGVETWMGHCHGWAPAAFSVGRPKTKITVLAADGKTKITFYPADIRALTTLLWANTNPTTKFIGGRCNTKNPPMDANGRITEAACRDINPATWHEAVVNQIGVAKRSMVLDVTFDYEVWNQPFYKYSYTYFNPQTKEASATLAGAKVAKGFAGDKFAAHRSPKATSIVGIAMDAVWIVETLPGHTPVPTSMRDDLTNGARYLYDLEIDAQGNVIGGEWYQNSHPDFLWTPPPGTHARAPGEPAVTWDGKTALPAAVRTAAASLSPNGYPIGAIIEKLAARSASGK